MIVELHAAQVPIAGIQLLAENALVGQAKDTEINSIDPSLEGTQTHRRTKSTPNTVIGRISLLATTATYSLIVQGRVFQG